MSEVSPKYLKTVEQKLILLQHLLSAGWQLFRDLKKPLSIIHSPERPTDQPIHFDAIHHYGPALSLSQQRISSNSIQQRTSFAPPSPPILDPKARAKFIISLFTIRCTRTTYKLGARSVVRLLNMAPGSLRARCGDDGDQKRPEQS